MARVLALVSLLACLAIPVLYFRGQIGLPASKTLLAVSSLAWFVFAAKAVARRQQKR